MRYFYLAQGQIQSRRSWLKSLIVLAQVFWFVIQVYLFIKHQRVKDFVTLWLKFCSWVGAEFCIQTPKVGIVVASKLSSNTILSFACGRGMLMAYQIQMAYIWLWEPKIIYSEGKGVSSF